MIGGLMQEEFDLIVSCVKIHKIMENAKGGDCLKIMDLS